MDRTACVDVPALPLQLLISRHPGWIDRPAAVLDHDKPQGLILWVNKSARRRGVLPGMKYAAGLALASDLRGAEISTAEITEGVATLTELLRRFTPEVEPSQKHPGIFWLDASGLQPLYASLEDWADAVRRHLRGSGFHCRVVVGFTRFGTYATARAGVGGSNPRRGVKVFPDATTERKAARRVPLRRLEIDPELRDVLGKLGIHTVGAFSGLPEAGIRKRFGPEAHRLYRHATGDLALPLQPQPAARPLARHLDLESPETDAHRLLFLIKHSLDPLLETLATRQEALTAIEIRLRLETGVGKPRQERTEQIRSAAPTLDVRQILNLIHLRFESHELPSGVTEVDLVITSARASREQLRLFRQQSRRDLQAANRALARVRAEFGERSVVRARLADGHLPEARFVWQPLEHVARPAPKRAEIRPLVRRLLARPRRLPSRPRHEPDGWLLRGADHGQVVQQLGPHVVSGGWWRTPIHREYYFARTRDDGWSWVYYDRRRRRWFLHGEIE